MKYLSAFILLGLLSACSGNYTFNSNLDRDNINEYFSVSDVIVYDANNPVKGSYEIKGLVDGESCQANERDVPASIADARTKARKAALKKGANGIIIKNCTLVNDTTHQCFSQAFCVAQAIKTP